MRRKCYGTGTGLLENLKIAYLPIDLTKEQIRIVGLLGILIEKFK